MGKLEFDPNLTHFSHPHLLHLCNIQQHETNNSIPCSACKLQGYGYMYVCMSCNFSLHQPCTQLPQLITHPSHNHPLHTLTLLPTSIYPGGKFNCDACNRHGDGFSYHCNQCDFDLHVVCASRPLSVSHGLHPHHPLNLTFHPPYNNAKGFSCDICRKMGSSKQWLYRCTPCEFDAHLECATASPQPVPPLQHHHSFQTQTQLQGPPPPLQHHHSFPGAVQNDGQNGGMGNMVMNSMVQGFVEGAAQQVGQTFMQGIIGGGGGNSDGGGGGDGVNYGYQSVDSSSTSALDIGSSILGGMFGDSSTQY